MKNIRRSAKKQIAKIVENVHQCEVFSLYNNFVGESVDKKCVVDLIQNKFVNDRMKRTTLTQGDNGKYTLKIHSNEWFTFQA